MAVDVAQAFLPADARLVDIVNSMLAQAAVTKAAALDAQPLPVPHSADVPGTPDLPSTCSLPALPKHFIGRADTVTRIVSFMDAPANVGTMLYGGPGVVSAALLFSQQSESALVMTCTVW